MLLGLDVGGTHTDVVVVGKKGIVASSKVITDHDNLLSSINAAFENVLKDVAIEEITRINLSTTLSTNAIVEEKVDKVGVLVSAGPGIDSSNYAIGSNFHIIDGSIDHRGTEIQPLDQKQLAKSIDECVKNNIRVFAGVTKFSTRNPAHENLIKDQLADSADFVTVGHLLAGQLNYPRRIATAYYNSAVWRLYNDFATAIEKSILGNGVKARINILKADGGTMPLSVSRLFPVETILSGPAASVMGIIALCDISEDSIILDIGGTTTDIAIFASGAPLIESEGIALTDHLTLVRALKTKSIGIGGDSLLKISDGKVMVGPERMGPAMADGGEVPTLVDALNFQKINYGNREASISGIVELAKKHSIEPEQLAKESIAYAVRRIREEVEEIVRAINEKPVYTVHEILEGKTIEPTKLYVMGGPAEALSDLLKQEFRREVVVPKNFSIANAIGAALTKTTIDVELFADSEKRVLLIPNLNIEEKIPGSYTLDDAKVDAKKHLSAFMERLGYDVSDDTSEIIEAISFNMVGGFMTSGRNIRVKCQIKPGISRDYSVR
jgi:N-methylhydantoinase A/oxoprolinase/acetone carboxylase beta subunit